MEQKSKFKKYIDRRAKYWMGKGKIKIAAYGKALADARKKGLHPPKKNASLNPKSKLVTMKRVAHAFRSMYGNNYSVAESGIPRTAEQQYAVRMYNYFYSHLADQYPTFADFEQGLLKELRKRGNPKTSVGKYSKRAARFLKKEIPKLMREGYAQPRAVAAALSAARRKGMRLPNHPLIGAVQGLAGTMSLLNPMVDYHKPGLLGSTSGASWADTEDEAKGLRRGLKLGGFTVRNPPTVATCPVCGGEAHPMGTLGKTTHYKCRQCGAEFPYHPVPESIDLGGGRTWHKDLSKVRRSRNPGLTPLAQTMHRAAIPAFVNPKQKLSKLEKCECEHISHQDGTDHPYGESIGSSKVSTRYGKFWLCSHCLWEGHMFPKSNPSQRQIIKTPFSNPLPTPLAQTMHRAAIPAFSNPSMQSIIRTPMQNPKRNCYGMKTRSGSLRSDRYGRTSSRRSYGSAGVKSPSVGLIKIYDKITYSEMKGSANSGSHGIKKTDVFEHTYPHPPSVFGVLKSGMYHLPKGSVVLKPKEGYSVFKVFGSGSALSKTPVGKVLSKAGYSIKGSKTNLTRGKKN